MNRLALLFALSCLALSATAASQKVYEWIDAAGVRHYSDAPPPKGTAGVTLINMHNSAPPTQAPAPTADNPATNPDPAKAKTAQQAPQMTPEERASACQTASANLKLLQSNPPEGLHTTGADGKTKQITASDLQGQIAVANQQIRTFCQ